MESIEEQLELANNSLLHANLQIIEQQKKIKISIDALNDIQRGYDKYETYSGTRCADIARAALMKLLAK